MADNIFDELDFELLHPRDKRFRIEDALSEHLQPLEDVPSSPITSDLYSDETNNVFGLAAPSDEGKDELSDSDKHAHVIVQISVEHQHEHETTKDADVKTANYEPTQPMECSDENEEGDAASPFSSEHETPSKEDSDGNLDEESTRPKRKRARSDAIRDPDYDYSDCYSPPPPRRSPSSPTAGRNKRNHTQSPLKVRPSQVQRTHRGLPKEATDLLKGWLLEHVYKPYPTEDEKLKLISQTGLTMTQLNNFFTNARRRYLKRILSKSSAAHYMSD
jgi:hypothetical protein